MPTLQWMTRDEDLERAARVPYRLLESVSEYAGGDLEARATTPNMLIQGDNLDALKSLLPFYAGKVKCIYIDPPYNTGSAFEHYDDNLEHSQWLAMMWPRLELLRELLSEDGSIWVTLDDRESHYLRVLCDEIFGRKNFVGNVVWQSKDTPGNNATTISQTHNHVIVYKKSKIWSPIRLARTEKQTNNYKNTDNDPRGPWLGAPMTRVEHRDRDYYALNSPDGREVFPPSGSSWRRPPDTIKELIADNRLYWGKNGSASFPMEKKFLSEAKTGVTPQTWWPYQIAGSTRNASAEMKKLFGSKTFDTPKPEKLISLIFQISTSPGDLVLDSFLGSGTTAAVAHKMGRRWIGIEMGDHAVTHCVPRLRKVVEGEQGGISEAVNWKGGGAFRYYKLGEPVFGSDGRIRDGLSFNVLSAHVWFSETRTPLLQKEGKSSAFLGRYGEGDEARGLALLYNGILGDKSISGGNVLTSKTLEIIRSASNGFEGPITIYGERSAFGPATLEREDITFRQTPYDVAAVRRS